jgi:hypothetical protein
MNLPVVAHFNDPPDPERERVYIGRAVPRRGVKASVWGNPYRVTSASDVSTILDLYRAHVLQTPELVEALPDLEGCELACWCRYRGETEPPCQGDVLVALVNELQKGTD